MKHVDTSNGYFEPEVIHTFLPGCRHCGGSHPLARKPQMPAETCPDCGKPASNVGPSHREKAVLTGGRSPSLFVGKVFLSIGKALSKFAKRN